MDMVLNVLASLLLVLLLLLRRSFTSLIDRPAKVGDPRHAWLRALLILTCAAATAFVAAGLWMLASNGYIPVAMFLGVFAALSMNVLRRRIPSPGRPSDRA